MTIELLITKIGLACSSTGVFIAVFLLGVFLLNARAFSQAMMLLLFTLIYNLYLKSLWQIPLKPPLEGWAFPSGHTHAAWVFWGWLAWHYKKWIGLILFLCIMGLSSYAMILAGYHLLPDILAAMGFGTMSLLLFYGLNKIPPFNENLFIVNVLIGGIALLILFKIPMPYQAKPYLWVSHGSLMGLAIGWLFNMQFKEKPLKLHQNAIVLVACVAGLIGIHFIMSAPPNRVTPQNFYFIKGFIMMFWLFAGKRLFNPLCARI